MLYLQHDGSQLQSRTLEELCADTPGSIIIDGQLHLKKNLTPAGKPKPKFDYHVPQAAKCETNFRHSYWKAKREMVHIALASAGESTFALDRFAQCGSGCVIEVSPSTKKLRLKACYCHSRHCEPCMRAKANKIAGNLRTKLEEDTECTYRFITLTLKHNSTTLQEQIRRLLASFKKLRKYAVWADSQTGGAAALEVKWNPKTREWHPHLHVISAGNFLHKRDLSEGWKKATGDSTIVDIRLLDSPKDAAHYVSKYVTKGTSGEVWQDASAAQEWIIAMKGVRSCMTYGSWRGYKLLQVQEETKDWRPLTSMIELYAAMDRKEDWAIGIMLRLEEKRLAREKTKPPQAVLWET